jgi:hypothetical protein
MPMSRGLALVVAGLWLGMLVTSWITATASFRCVDRVLGPEARPELQAKLAPLTPEDRRMALRHLAAEINRWMFARWAAAQWALAAGLVLAAWPAEGAPRTLALVAAVVTIAQTLLGPSIEALGRSLDFVPRPLPPDIARTFGVLHAAYVLLDLAKGGVLAVLALLVARLPLK